MLAVTIFLGIIFASSAIGNNGNDFYDKANYRDIEVVSTYLLTEKDINELANLEGVFDVEGIYQTTGVMEGGDVRRDVDIVSASERINRPIIIDGRLPEKINECCIEQSMCYNTNLKIGDSIKVVDKHGKQLEHLKTNYFVITGIIQHADLACNEKFIPTSRYVIVKADAFDKESYQNCYVKAEMTLNGTRGLYRFNDKYWEEVDKVLTRVKQIADKRAIERYEEVHGQIQGKIDDGQAKIDDASAQLTDASASLSSGKEQLESGESQLSDVSESLNSAESQLTDVSGSLVSGSEKIDEGQRKLDEASKKLRDARKQLDKYEAELKDAKKRLDEATEIIKNADEYFKKYKKTLEESMGIMEDAKDSARKLLHDALYKAIGHYADDWIDWSSKESIPDIDDPKASATKFAITKNIVIDLNKSMGDNIFAILSKSGISEDKLRMAFQEITQIYEELSDGTTWFDKVVEYCVEQYKDKEDKYDKFALIARTWDDNHKEYLDNKEIYRNGMIEYNKRLDQYNEGRKKLDEGWDKYYSGVAQYNAGRKRLNEAKSTWESVNQQYQDGQSQLEDGRQSYASGVEALESGKQELSSRQSQYDQGMSEYESAVDKLNLTRDQLKKMDECRWIVLSNRENHAYNTIWRSANNMADIAHTFSGVFMFVAALVIFSTLGRIIDEQRKMVGATKAMGLYNREVFAKYLTFGLSGTVIGMLIGVGFAYYLIQHIILTGYSPIFVYGKGTFNFSIPLTIVVLLTGVVLAVLTVLFACYNLLKSTAVNLMQDKAPDIRHKSKSSKSKTTHLYSKLIIFNMLTDKKRVIATIISITGCCALLVGGFTIQYAIQNCITGQFDKYELYDQKMFFESGVSNTAAEEMAAKITATGSEYISIYDGYHMAGANDRLIIAELVAGDLASMDKFYNLTDVETGEKINTAEEGVWIHKKVSETYDIDKGEDIIIYNASMKPYRVRVAGVFNNFIGYYMFMTNENYEALFGSAPEMNAFFVKNNGADKTQLIDSVKEVKGFKSVTDTSELRDKYQSMSKVLNAVSVICIVMSAMMAYFILLNLVSMFIHQKKRELTIMRICGFTLSEVVNYVARELVVSTVIGIILGLISGSLLGLRVIKLLESDQIQFDRSIQWNGWLFSVLITILFAAVICVPVFRKLKYLKLSDIT